MAGAGWAVCFDAGCKRAVFETVTKEILEIARKVEALGRGDGAVGGQEKVESEN